MAQDFLSIANGFQRLVHLAERARPKSYSDCVTFCEKKIPLFVLGDCVGNCAWLQFVMMGFLSVFLLVSGEWPRSIKIPSSRGSAKGESVGHSLKYYSNQPIALHTSRR